MVYVIQHICDAMLRKMCCVQDTSKLSELVITSAQRASCKSIPSPAVFSTSTKPDVMRCPMCKHDAIIGKMRERTLLTIAAILVLLLMQDDIP
jgi:hypothetical protein